MKPSAIVLSAIGSAEKKVMKNISGIKIVIGCASWRLQTDNKRKWSLTFKILQP